jgi:hypothetical protein
LFNPKLIIMKTLKILFMLCIMLGFAAPSNSHDRGKSHERPFKGIFYANVIATNGAVETLSLTGHATHVGNFTGIMYFDKTTIAIDPVSKRITGVKTYGTIVAAHGDKINFGPDDPGMVITGPGPSGTMSGITKFTGGTGRFDDCSGEILNTGIFDMGNDYAKWTSEGWIKFNADDRRDDRRDDGRDDGRED